MSNELDFADLLASYIVENLPSDLAVCESKQYWDQGVCWGVDWSRVSEGEAAKQLAKLIREHKGQAPK